MKKYSIQRKLFRYFIAFVGILVSLLWLFQIVFLDDFYRMIKSNAIENMIADIQRDIKDNRDVDLEAYARNNEIHIRLILRDGTVIGESQSMQSPDVPFVPAREMARIFEAATVDGVQITFDGMGISQKTMSYAVRLSNDLVLFVQANLVPIDATVNTLTIQLFIITGILILVALILSIYISKKVSKPITQLNDTVKKLGSGDFSVQFDESGFQEIEELSKALNEMKDDLGQIQELKDELLGNVGHDLQTPLTMILGYAELMEDIPDERTHDNINLIKREAQYLSTMVKDMMDLSRIKKSNPTTFNINTVMVDVLDRFKAQGHSITFNPDQEYTVTCDKTHLIQVVYNLISNAINHTESDKKIELKFETQSDKLKISIIDEGVGIAKDDLPHLWDRYYRSKNTHHRTKQGSGLGLSIVKRIFEMEAIEYGVESTENVGSTFWFILPEELI